MDMSITNAARRVWRLNEAYDVAIQDTSFNVSRTAAAPKDQIATSIAGGATRAPTSPNPIRTATGGPMKGQLSAWRIFEIIAISARTCFPDTGATISVVLRLITVVCLALVILALPASVSATLGRARVLAVDALVNITAIFGGQSD